MKAEIRISSHIRIFRFLSRIQPTSFSQQVQSYQPKWSTQKIPEFLFYSAKYLLTYCEWSCWQIQHTFWLGLPVSLVDVQWNSCCIEVVLGPWCSWKMERQKDIHCSLGKKISTNYYNKTYDSMLFEDVELLQFS
jgi:hypothetical protein